MGVMRFFGAMALLFWPLATWANEKSSGMDSAIWVSKVVTNEEVAVSVVEGPSPFHIWKVTITEPALGKSGRTQGKPYSVRLWDERPTLRQVRRYRGDDLLIYSLELDPRGAPVAYSFFHQGRLAKHLRFNERGQVGLQADNDGTTEVTYDPEGRPESRLRTRGENPPVVEKLIYDWQGLEVVRERMFGGDGLLRSTLTRSWDPTGRVVTERRATPAMGVVGTTTLTYDEKGRAILAETEGNGRVTWAYDGGDQPSRSAVFDALGRLQKEVTLLWKKQKSEGDLFEVGWVSDEHEVFGVRGLEGLRDRLLLRRDNGQLEEERQSQWWKDALAVRRTVGPDGAMHLTFDGGGRLLEKRLTGASEEGLGSVRWAWDQGRPVKMEVRNGAGVVTRTISFKYREGVKGALPKLPLEAPDPFFTWGEGFVAWSARGLTEPGKRSEGQASALLAATATMEKMGLTAMLERDPQGDLFRIRTLEITNGKYARTAIFTEYGRLCDDDLRQSSLMEHRVRRTGMAGEETGDLVALLRHRFESFAEKGIFQGDEATAFYKSRLAVVLGTGPAATPVLATGEGFGPRGQTNEFRGQTRSGSVSVRPPHTADSLWEDYTVRRSGGVAR